MKIATRLTITIFSLSVIPLTILAFFSMNEIDNSLELAELTVLEDKIQHQIMQMEDRVFFGSEEGIIIANTPSIKKISQITNSEEGNSEVSDVLEFELDRTSNFLKTVLEEKDEIQSIAFHDLEGVEVIKVYKDEDGEIIQTNYQGNIFTHVNLLSQIEGLEKGEIFTEIIDGQFDDERRYFVAHATPVFSEGKIQGHVVWNSYSNLEIFPSSVEETDVELHYFDQDLFHISSSGDDFLSKTYELGPNIFESSEISAFKIEQIDIAYGKFYYNPHDLEKYILVVGITDELNTTIIHLVFFITVAIVGAIVLILARFFSYQFLRPLESLSKISKKLLVGDLTPIETEKRSDEFGELITNFSNLMKKLNEFSSEVTRVAREVGREGKLGGQAKVEGVEGKWRELTDTVNEFSENIATPIREIIKMTTAVAGGDLNQKFTADVKGELIKLKQSLNTMTEQLKRVDIARDEFASMVTHELKTPLVPIKGYTQMLMEEGTIGELNQEQYFAVNEIMNNSRRLEKLIEDVMMAHRLEMNQVAFHAKSFNVKEFLGKIPLSFKKIAEGKKIKISTSKVDSKLTGFADTDRLSEVFTNLIQNSVDFVEPIKGVIEIHAKDNGEHVQFSVKDNGLGIPLDKQAQIFKTKFYQVDTSMERKHGGSGLGLVIVKGIVEQGGGKIWFNSKQNEGTEMIFTIPKSWN